MKKDMALEMWKNIITLVTRGSSLASVKNPMLEFSAPGNSEQYADLSDEQYSELLDSFLQQSYGVWRGKDEENAGSLLLRALASTDIDFECIIDLSATLAKASAKTKYRTEPANIWDRMLYYADDDEQDGENDTAQTDAEGRAFGDWFPKEIEKWLHTKGGIVGQNAAVKAASMIIFNHINGRPSVSLFAAPTGSGKTQLWRALQKSCGEENIIICDASSLTAEGWKGSNKISTIFKDIPIEKRSHIILVLDEFDKLIEPQYGAGGTNYSDLVQNQLLKLFDHDTLIFGADSGNGFSVDASGISVVLLGAFQHLMDKKGAESTSIGFGGRPYEECNYKNSEVTPEDLIAFGMRSELVGRISKITSVDPLSKEDIVRIGEREVKNLQEHIHREITIDERSLELLSEEAIEKGLGARWMRTRLSNLLDELMYEDPVAVSYRIEYGTSDSGGQSEYRC